MSQLVCSTLRLITLYYLRPTYTTAIYIYKTKCQIVRARTPRAGAPSHPLVLREVAAGVVLRDMLPPHTPPPGEVAAGVVLLDMLPPQWLVPRKLAAAVHLLVMPPPHTLALRE